MEPCELLTPFQSVDKVVTFHPCRLQQAEEEKARLAREELERQQAAEREETLRKQHEVSRRRQAQFTQMQLLKAKETAHNLRVRFSCFIYLFVHLGV